MFIFIYIYLLDYIALSKFSCRRWRQKMLALSNTVQITLHLFDSFSGKFQSKKMTIS